MNALTDLSEDISNTYSLLHKRLIAVEQWIDSPPVPLVSTDRRDMDDTNQLLTAKGMYDHTQSGDHDTRYYTRTQSDTALATKVAITDIVDNTTTQVANKPLSAKAGYQLQQSIDQIQTLLNTNDTNLDQLQEIVDFIKLNRSDLDSLTIASISGLSTALGNKVDKVSGYGLSEVNYSPTDKAKVDAALTQVNLGWISGASTVTIGNSGGSAAVVSAATATDAGIMSAAQASKLAQLTVVGYTISRFNDTTTEALYAKAMYDHNNSTDHDGRYYRKTEVDSLLVNKVDVVEGMGLSQENFTTTLKNKLNGIEANAQVNVGTNITLSTSGNTVAIQSSTGTGGYLPTSTTTTAGIITKEQHVKLASVETNAQVNVATNLTTDRTSDTVRILSSTGAAVTLLLAATTGAGLMSMADKTKLDSVQSGAQANVATNLGITRNTNDILVTSSTGTNVTLPLVTTAQAGLMSYTDKSKLDTVQLNAEPNAATTISRTSTSTTTVLSAKAMYDHVASGDHDSRYALLSGNLTTAIGASCFKGHQVNTWDGTNFTGNATRYYAAYFADLNAAGGGICIRANDTSTTHHSITCLNSANSPVFYVRASDGFVEGKDFKIGSDARYKTNIRPIENALSKVLALVGHITDRVDIDAKNMPSFIAQRVKAIIPEVVGDNGEGYLNISYPLLIPYLVEAFKTSYAEFILEKRSRIRLEDQIATLTALLKDQQLI